VALFRWAGKTTNRKII